MQKTKAAVIAGGLKQVAMSSMYKQTEVNRVKRITTIRE
jgi:hypothetical protein